VNSGERIHRKRRAAGAAGALAGWGVWSLSWAAQAERSEDWD
jgi:hypothetical protein